ncbi:MAG: LacI family transcriptional regulator [Treponema sp.]|nr:LacI family transcriptional regulator [Treponema sp.]
MASALKNRRTGIIGNILSPDMNNPFFSNISMSLKTAALRCGYHILPVYIEPVHDLAEHILHAGISSLVEGLIFTAPVLVSPSVTKKLMNMEIPVIMIERPLKLSGVDKVLLDDFCGSALAAQQFLSFGHRNIGFIGRECNSGAVETNRFKGFAETLKANNAPLDEKMIVLTGGYRAEYGYEAMKKIITANGKKPPIACFFTSDMLVCGALQYLYEADLRVPEDVSIIGYDNTLSSICSPPITSIGIPYDEIGVTSISLFQERREQGRVVDKEVRLNLFLVDRGSVSKEGDKALRP